MSTAHQTIWKATLDQGLWHVKVIADGHGTHSAVMQIVHAPTGEVRHTEATGVSAGTQHGPKAADISVWMQRALAWTTAHPYA